MDYLRIEMEPYKDKQRKVYICQCIDCGKEFKRYQRTKHPLRCDVCAKRARVRAYSKRRTAVYRARIWVPLEERYPEDDRYVMVSYNSSVVVGIGYYVQEEGKWYTDSEEEAEIYGIRVTAWRELPPAYGKGTTFWNNLQKG